MRLWITLLVVVLVLLVIAVAIALIVRRRRQAREGNEPEPLEGSDADRSAPLPSLVRELRPSFAASMARLRRSVRGMNFRYDVPWYLLIGPADAGKTTLIAHAPRSSAVEPQSAQEGRAASGIEWHYFDGGVIIDVSASLAMPGTRGDMAGWRALLYLLRRHRPRRPIAGVIVAVPATVLLDGSWKARTHDLGAAIRERLVLAQAELGFAVPVYVVVTHADQVPGFSAFTDALPDNLQQNMFGWSNPHTLDGTFEGEWIEQAFEELTAASSISRSSCSR
jgi:type VI secretion system protein ImpL